MSKSLIGMFVVSLLLSRVLFAGELAKFSMICSQDTCDKPYSKTVSYHYLEPKKIDQNLKVILERIAGKQAQIWGDTILEGDYAADGNTRLDQVVNLYKSYELIGYLITYSERAWDTSVCQYDGIHDSTLLGCAPGRIVESSYVSLDFKDFFYDEKTAAVFKEDKYPK